VSTKEIEETEDPDSSEIYVLKSLRSCQEPHSLGAGWDLCNLTINKLK
jgi:hypothetical protein